MYVVSGLCLLLNFVELFHLGLGGIRDGLRGRRQASHLYYSSRSNHYDPPGYHSVLQKDKTKLGNGNVPYHNNFGALGPESFEMSEVVHRHLKLAQEQLNMAYQASRELPHQPRSGIPESNCTAIEQNRLKFGQEGESACAKKAESHITMGLESDVGKTRRGWVAFFCLCVTDLGNLRTPFV
eukprot:g32059.t1